MNRIRVYGLTCIAMVAAVAARATTIVMPTDEQLIAKSPVIVSGTVLSTSTVERDGAIWTEASISVARVLKGSADMTITVREMGGALGERITKLYGTPEFSQGEHVLLFLEPSPRGGYRTMDLYVGKLSEGKQLDGRRLWLRDDIGAEVTLLNANFDEIHAKNIQRDAAAFETFVAERVAGRPGLKNYGVENPVLVKETNRTGGVQANFTLISEPTVYRWRSFDSGTTAQWYSSGTQTGYSGGGVTELQTGISSWTGYSSAKIYYAYAGVRSGSLGGLSGPNGANEVLFNDPLNEISGTYNASTGGVVGTGGFNGVSGSVNWTGPFVADATHTTTTYRAYGITEGNLTIQDGVSPGAGIGSTRLAEILAHEFGHTLGFGHTEVTGSLMSAYVTGLGPSLRADDQVAARWLYPNGGGGSPGTQVPAGPSGLVASPSGSSVFLSWADNASNETGQSIYYATGNGAFTKATDVSANATSATLSGFAAGTYRFYVIAFNSAGNSAASNTATATVVGTQINAAFSFTPQSGTANVTTFTFYDETQGSVSSRLWNFGDGSTSTFAVASHVYKAAGQYTVTLSVTGGGTSSQVSKTVVVTSALAAAFTWSPSSPTTNDTISFADQSTGGVSSWYWTFGDGTFSQQQNPTKKYTTAGTYSVMLSVTRGSETSYVSKSLAVAASTPTTPPVSYRSVVSAAAQQNGIGGTSWRTELSLFNAGSQGANITLLFLPGAGGSMISRSLYLAPRQSATYANTLLDLFGMANGAGALAIEATSAGANADLRVTSRTFTSGSIGTYGQAVPDTQADALETTLYLTGIQSNAAYRTNIGLVNRGSIDVATTLTLYNDDGGVVSTANVTIPANNFQQSSLATYFPEVAGRSYDVLSMRMTASSNSVIACASIINNTSQDPVYVQAIPARNGNSLTLAAVGRANGANGTFWRSDVTVFNETSSRTTYTLRYAGTTKTLSLGARETVMLADIVTQMGLGQGMGPLEISWSSGTTPIVTSRTYTTDENGGTYGQSVDPIEAFGNQMFVPGLRSDFNYRSNVGFLNGGTEAEQLTISLLSPSGFELASTTITLQPNELMQQGVTVLFPGVSASAGSFTLQMRGDANAKVFAFGSMIDNASGDPVFFAGR